MTEINHSYQGCNFSTGASVHSLFSQSRVVQFTPLTAGCFGLVLWPSSGGGVVPPTPQVGSRCPQNQTPSSRLGVTCESSFAYAPLPRRSSGSSFSTEIEVCRSKPPAEQTEQI